MLSALTTGRPSGRNPFAGSISALMDPLAERSWSDPRHQRAVHFDGHATPQQRHPEHDETLVRFRADQDALDVGEGAAQEEIAGEQRRGDHAALSTTTRPDFDPGQKWVEPLGEQLIVDELLAVA